MAIKICPQCDQQLRFPDHIGGMLMACPSCGQKFYADFKLAHPAQPPKPASVRKADQQEEAPKPPGGLSVLV